MPWLRSLDRRVEGLLEFSGFCNNNNNGNGSNKKVMVILIIVIRMVLVIAMLCSNTQAQPLRQVC